MPAHGAPTTAPGDDAAPAERAASGFHRADKLSASFAVSIAINQFFMAVTAYAPKFLAVYQVRTFFPSASEEVIGPATGGLGSAFNLAQLATSFLYGWLSDATGRPKALILVANVACGAGATAFALATNYQGALASRIVAGAFMTSGVVMKALIGMTLTKQAQAYAMAYRTLGAGTAQIITPLIVGQLVDPCGQWGWSRGCGEGGFFQQRPFALSALFVAGVAVVATLMNFFMIPDVRTKHGAPVATGGGCCAWLVGLCARRKQGGVEPADGTPSCAGSDATTTPLPSVKPPMPSVFGSARPSAEMAAVDGTAPPAAPGAPPPPPAAVRRFASMPASAFARALSSSMEEARTGLARTRTFVRASSLVAAAPATLTAWGRDGFAAAGLEGNVDLDGARAAASEVRERRREQRLASGLLDVTPLPVADAEAATPPKPTPWFRHRPALLSIMAYAAVTFLFDAYLDLINLYGSAQHNANVPGLALPADRLTLILSLGGACVVAFSVLAYPHIQRAIGVARCARYGLAAGVPTALIPPAAFYAFPSERGVMSVLALGQVLYGFAMALTSTSSQILSNLCAPDGQIGAVNGAGNMLSALSRAIEPLAMGGLWALAATDNFPDQWLPWGVLAGMFVVTLGLYVFSGLKDDDVDAGDVGREAK